MPYNPKFHKRQSIRLKNYDYSKEGLYFITICVKDRKCLFGEIDNGQMKINTLVAMANTCWLEIPLHYPQVKLHSYSIMPNHIHGIIEIMKTCHDTFTHNNNDISDGICDNNVGICHGKSLHQQPNQRHFAKPIANSISTIINQYKSTVKRWCNKNGYPYFQWQSRFYDHIIRNDKSYQTINEYIVNNPKNWHDDKFYIFLGHAMACPYINNQTNDIMQNPLPIPFTIFICTNQ